MDRSLFEEWRRVTSPSPTVVRQMYMLLYSMDDAEANKVLSTGIRRRLPASQLLSYFPQGVDTTGLENALAMSSVAAPVFTVHDEPEEAEKVEKEPSFLEKMKARISKNTVIAWSVVGVIVVGVILFLLWLFWPGSSTPQYNYSGGDGVFSSPSGLGTDNGLAPAPLPASTEAPPQLVDPNPLDFASSTWLKALQLLLMAEILGITVSLFGDAKVRKQLLDAVVTVIMAAMTIFIVLPGNTEWWVAALILLFEVGVVLYASISGGRDFTPTGAYFLFVGTIGGLLVNKIEAFQTVFHVASAPVLPIIQLGVLFQLRDWAHLMFPVMVYLTIFTGVGITLFEGLRPSEDKNPRWGTIIGALAGLILYFGILHGLHLAAWASFLVAYSSSIGVSALSQSERAIPLVTNRWGVRSIFDGSMLFIAILLVFQIFTGLVG